MSGSKAQRIGTAANPVDEMNVGVDDIEESTVLDDMFADLGKKVRKENVTFTVPERPEYALIFDPNIDYKAQYEKWVKVCEVKKSKETDFLKLANIVISNTNVGLVFRGQERFDSRGNPLAVTHEKIHEALGVPIGSTSFAIKALYGVDGHIIQTMRRIVDAAGYSLDDEVSTYEDNGPLGI